MTKASRFTLSADAGNWIGAALRGLPKGGELTVRLETDGHVAVLLLDEDAYRRYPEVDAPLVAGETSDEYGFTAVLPESGDYILVLDNRSGSQARQVSVYVRAAARPRPRSGDPWEEVNAMLELVETGLKRVFVLDALSLKAAPCGTLKPFDESDAVIVCTEYAQLLLDDISDSNIASATMMFSLFYEIGHVLLGDPQTKSGHDPDELATGLMAMLGYREQARAQARFFASDDPQAQAVRGRLPEDSAHPLSAERAARVLAWLDDDKLLARWQSVLVPRLQTRMLEQLRRQPAAWTALDLVERELASRGAPPAGG